LVDAIIITVIFVYVDTHAKVVILKYFRMSRLNTHQTIIYKQKYRHCNKKLTRLVFDFGVIPPVLSTQRTVVVNRSRRSRSVDNSCGLTPKSSRRLY